MTDYRAQLTWQPEVSGEKLVPLNHLVVGGMGGSALAGYALQFIDKKRDVLVHESYDLPSDTTPNTLYVAVSYSGNTEETLSFAKAVQKKALPLACVASGGKLVTLAEKAGAPLVVVPTGEQPRDAVVYQLRALLKLVGEEALLKECESIVLDEQGIATQAHLLAEQIHEKIPVIYTPARAEVAGRIWQAQLNESAKTPAFMRVVPASNHFDLEAYDSPLKEHLLPFFIHDPKGDPRVEKRLSVLEEFLGERGVRGVSVTLQGESALEACVHTWVLAIHTAHACAEMRGVNPDKLLFVEEFKKRL